MKKANHRERVMRPGQPFQFTWQAARNHEWAEARPIQSLSEAPGEPEVCLIQVGLEAVRYKPLQSFTGLFRDFACLDLNRAAIQTFANDYGMLEEMAVRMPNGNVRRGEPLHLWFEQIKEVRRWLTLYDATQDAITSGSGEKLKDVIKWHDKDAVEINHDGYREWIATNILHPELLTRFFYGDLVRPALYQLQRVINEKLERYQSTPRLLWENGKLLYFIWPKSLLAAIWMQFALAIDGNRQYRRCSGCERWFEIGGGTKRSDSETCTPTCRKRRERKETDARKNAQRSKRSSTVAKSARRPA